MLKTLSQFSTPKFAKIRRHIHGSDQNSGRAIFCPVQAHIELDDGHTYITRFTNGDDGWYSQTTNNIDHPVQVLWRPTPQITCPNNLADACPVNDMLAYSATVQERRACVFT